DLLPRRVAIADRGRRFVAFAEVLRRPFGDDLAGGDDRHPVGEALRLVHVMGGEEDRLAERPQSRDHVPELAPRRWVEAGRRLVEEEELRVAAPGKADVESPLLAAGELARPFVGLLLQADQPDRLLDRARVAEVPGVQFER